MYTRNDTKEINIGGVKIGGDNPVVIQSMTNTKTENIDDTIKQILKLEQAGCQIIRSTIKTSNAACAIKDIKSSIHIPIVADIHFDYKMAIEAIENGADKIRINPGNIGSVEHVKLIVDAAKEYNVPIRIGINSGSLEKNIILKYNGVTAEGLCESAIRNIELLEDMDFTNIVVSIKSSNVAMCIKSNELLSKYCRYPLHIGITESGAIKAGTIKSSIGIGAILSRNIGNTIRVSLSCDPLEEIYISKMILRNLNLKKDGIDVVACPTCGRTNINLIDLVNQVEELIKNYEYLNITIAIMGCIVNGYGECKKADLGIVGGNGEGLLIKNGKIIKKIFEDKFISTLKYELDHWK